MRYAEAASRTYSVDVRDILVEVGRGALASGQEDIALDLAAAAH
ncbi:hypothetical protein [Streptomyces sp. NPDC088847]